MARARKKQKGRKGKTSSHEPMTPSKKQAFTEISNTDSAVIRRRSGRLVAAPRRYGDESQQTQDDSNNVAATANAEGSNTDAIRDAYEAHADNMNNEASLARRRVHFSDNVTYSGPPTEFNNQGGASDEFTQQDAWGPRLPETELGFGEGLPTDPRPEAASYADTIDRALTPPPVHTVLLASVRPKDFDDDRLTEMGAMKLVNLQNFWNGQMIRKTYWPDLEKPEGNAGLRDAQKTQYLFFEWSLPKHRTGQGADESARFLLLVEQWFMEYEMARDKAACDIWPGLKRERNKLNKSYGKFETEDPSKYADSMSELEAYERAEVERKNKEANVEIIRPAQTFKVKNWGEISREFQAEEEEDEQEEPQEQVQDDDPVVLSRPTSPIGAIPSSSRTTATATAEPLEPLLPPTHPTLAARPHPLTFNWREYLDYPTYTPPYSINAFRTFLYQLLDIRNHGFENLTILVIEFDQFEIATDVKFKNEKDEKILKNILRRFWIWIAEWVKHMRITVPAKEVVVRGCYGCEVLEEVIGVEP